MNATETLEGILNRTLIHHHLGALKLLLTVGDLHVFQPVDGRRRNLVVLDMETGDVWMRNRHGVITGSKPCPMLKGWSTTEFPDGDLAAALKGALKQAEQINPQRFARRCACCSAWR